jgi:hypothetical protein
VTETACYEWPSQSLWPDLEEAQIFAIEWMLQYNHEGPNMVLGGLSPKQRLAMDRVALLPISVHSGEMTAPEGPVA